MLRGGLGVCGEHPSTGLRMRRRGTSFNGFRLKSVAIVAQLTMNSDAQSGRARGQHPELDYLESTAQDAAPPVARLLTSTLFTSSVPPS